MRDLYAEDGPSHDGVTWLGPHAALLHGFAQPDMPTLWASLQKVMAQAPCRRMFTPGGKPMSVSMTHCGKLGWISDARGYRYSTTDPITDQPWPVMPEPLNMLAQQAARQMSFDSFAPDTCLINHYLVGAHMGLHQDRDEHDLTQPIVSISLGISAVFLWGGLQRNDQVFRVALHHGDVLVWGGVDRLRFHGIAPIQRGHHPLTGQARINLTLRRAG